MFCFALKSVAKELMEMKLESSRVYFLNVPIIIYICQYSEVCPQSESLQLVCK